MKVFEEYLLDTDLSSNAGTWIWMSCSSFLSPFFSTIGPSTLSRTLDPNGDYIKRYIPELKSKC